jgi:hypothetical protein
MHHSSGRDTHPIEDLLEWMVAAAKQAVETRKRMYPALRTAVDRVKRQEITRLQQRKTHMRHSLTLLHL